MTSSHRGSRWPLRALSITVLAALPVVLPLPAFFAWLGGRPGRVPFDPILPHVGPVDLSVPVFVVLYGAIVTGIALILPRPILLVRTMQTYLLLLLMRMATMALVTLEAPPDLIPLRDPISTFFYPGGHFFAKDLFFSGHTATPFLLGLAVQGVVWRRVLFLASLLVGMGVIVQHVHWTIDVVAAPFFAWAAWTLSRRTMRWSGLPATAP